MFSLRALALNDSQIINWVRVIFLILMVFGGRYMCMWAFNESCGTCTQNHVFGLHKFCHLGSRILRILESSVPLVSMLVAAAFLRQPNRHQVRKKG